MFNLKAKGTCLYNNDEPFFLLGDTAWLLLHKLNLKEIERYLINRKSLGFNYIQAILVYNLEESINEMPHNHIDYSKDDFWTKAKKVVKLAAKLDIVVGLLPSWGSNVKKGFINETNAKEYALFLSNYFKDYSNIIWVIGGDVRGDVAYKIFNILGQTLKDNTNNLITFHPFGRTGSYLWFNDCSWLDFNMFQSGHRRYDQLTIGAWDDNNSNEDSFGEDSYKYVIKSRTYKNIKPILDGEPSYEGIVQGLHDVKEAYWEASHVRRYAYWSVFEGACGFIYGNNSIIQFYNYEDDGAYGVRESWLEALSSPGGAELQYLKDLMIECDFQTLKSHPELILNNKTYHHKTQVCANDNTILIYTYKGDKLDIDLSSYKNKKLDLYIMNPENNSKAYYDTITNQDTYTFRPTRKRELSNDWVLIFKESNK